MRRSREEAAETRRTAVEAASRLYRERGLDAVSIGEVMAAVGMTVGGFYRHFDSKEALMAEACAQAFADSSRTADAALETLLERYLSEAHRDTPAAGCPVPALVSTVGQQPAPVRRAFTEGVRRMLRAVSALAAPAPPETHTALVASLAGAVALARAIDDPALSARVLAQTRAFWSRALRATPKTKARAKVRPSRQTSARRRR